MQFQVSGRSSAHPQKQTSIPPSPFGFTLLCGSWFCCAEMQTIPTICLWIEFSPSQSAVWTAAIFNHNGVHLSMVLPFLPSLSLFLSLCSSPQCSLWGVLLFPTNIKLPYRQAHGPPSRGAAYWLLSFSKPQIYWTYLLISKSYG